MIRDKKQIQEAMKPIRAFILDMDGTIYLGNALFPYTRSFLDTVKQSGRAYYFFTNNSSKDVKTYIDKLHSMGIDIEQRQMMISTHVILRWLKEHHAGKRVYVVGTPALQAEFQHHGWQLDEEHPDIVVLGFDTTLTYDKLSKYVISSGREPHTTASIPISTVPWKTIPLSRTAEAWQG